MTFIAGNKSSWLVPVSICSASSPDKAIHRLVLEGKETSVDLEVDAADWVKVGLFIELEDAIYGIG
jgi:hypothetical protein